MKKLLIMLTATGLAGTLAAQLAPTAHTSSVVRDFYASDAWGKALAGYYGVNPGIEPGIPDNDREREVLGTIRQYLMSGSDQDVQLALTAVDNLFKDLTTRGLKPSPMLLQISGTLAMRLAETSTAQGDIDNYRRMSENFLRQAIDSNTGFPNFLRAHKNLANLLFRAERMEEARDHFVRALELGDRDAVTYGLLGAIYMEEGKLISAESALRNAMLINPNIAEFKQLLGNVLIQQERWHEAKEIFTELLMRRPNEVNYWMAQINCYIALESIDEATINLEIVRFMGKANAPALMLLGDVYINKEMLVEAAEAYLDAVKLVPSVDQVTSFIRAAETLNGFAAYAQAMSLIDAISKTYAERLTDRHVRDLLSLRSEINIATGKPEEAVENLEELLRHDPFNGRALLSLARYYADLEPEEGLPEDQETLQRRRTEQQALIYYERARHLNDDRDRQRALIGEAQLRVKRDELEQAVELLQEALALRYVENVNTYLQQVQTVLRHRRRG
jgi:tetratricopeptide (TPR) repeat protein